jgi:hypothetical protein
MDRHVKVLESLIEEIHELKVELQSMRIEKGDNPTWSREHGAVG